MVPADRILDTAVEQGATSSGSPGLITPSLDEMVDVAREMERRGLDLPLLIGGATTSRQHTAVRIAPEYGRETVHVLDASRVVGVVVRPARPGAPRRSSTRATATTRSGCASSTRSASRKPLLPLAEARANRRARRVRRSSPVPAVHGRAGRRARPRRRSRDYIDWQFFFHAWELKGRFPAILERPGGARELFDDAHAAPRRDRARRQSAGARASTGSGRRARRATTSCSTRARASASCRQQSAYGDSRPNRCLADFVAPGGATRTRRRVRGRRSTAPTSSRRATRPSTTTTTRSWSRRSPTGSPRRSPSGCTSGAARVVRAGEPLTERGSGRRALPRHPAGVRLPGLPRPHREAQAVRAARRRARRARADRDASR